MRKAIVNIYSIIVWFPFTNVDSRKVLCSTREITCNTASMLTKKLCKNAIMQMCALICTIIILLYHINLKNE